MVPAPCPVCDWLNNQTVHYGYSVQLRALGVDACRTGWIGVSLDGDEADASYAPTIEALLIGVGQVAVVAVDMPIGLPDTSRREADLLARVEIGQRRSSLFMTPVRSALSVPDHASASAENRRRTGFGISVQAYSLSRKIIEIDQWVRNAPARVVEAHPELSFARMNGAPLADAKTTWAGIETRRSLLSAHGIVLTGPLGMAGRQATVDDMLDAAAAAWTAQRVARGEASCLPAEPEVFSDGWPAAIWA
jgi:predicted RNase H-like nuclease